MAIIRPITEEEQKAWPKDVIVPLEAAFVDPRGAIQPLVDLAMESCVLITSRKGTTRADHYHQTDWHFCYVLSGSIEYLHRPHGSSETPKKTLVKEGQLFFTPPMVDHAMYFPQDSTFIVLGRNSRVQAVYEADVVRIPALRTEK